MSDVKQVLLPIDHTGANIDYAPDYLFWCPGCQCGHAVWVERPNGLGARWTFNGDMVRPTFQPSLLVQHDIWFPPVTSENMAEWDKAPWPQTKQRHVCHTFVTDGQIQYLGDCTHALAGKTIPMEPFND